MTENKTKATDASVDAYLDAITDASRRKDCVELIALMQKTTGHAPKMWGPSIVGFGSYHYKYATGREGDSCTIGFSSRKAAISVYLAAEGAEQSALLAKLGKHKMAKACLSIAKLADVEIAVLEQMLIDSAAEIQRRYG